MSHNNRQYQLISEALTLRPEDRQTFISQIDDPKLKEQVTQLLEDETALTQYLIHTAVPESAQPTPQTNDPIETSRLNRITIQKLLGQGGMGSVYLGFDEKLRRQVAIKSIRPEHLSMTSTQQRFIREARILSKINHPSICHIYDYIETPHGDYLVLEYIEGQELFKVSLNENRILDVLLNLCHALAAAHQHDIVHRDLKPDNIMITTDGQVKVLDFGIARSIRSPAPNTEQTQRAIDDNLTQHGSLVGTIRYMSPEQARGEHLTAASDMYSLGIIAQELLSGKAAYEVMATEQLLTDVQQGRRTTPNNIPQPFNQLIEQLTQSDPKDRPSAEQAAAAIEHMKAAPDRKRKRRNKIVAAVLIMALLAVMIWQWQSYITQKNSTDLVKSYTESINELVKSSEQIYVLPIHNTRPGIDALLTKATELFGEIAQNPALIPEDKLRLQGLIFTEAEEYQLAVENLEKIKSKQPTDNSLLARAWTGLYINVMTEYSDNYGVAQALQAENIRETYLQPTLKYINAAETQDPVVQAFKVSQTESLDQAIDLLNAIINQQSWNKSAIKLKAQIHMAQAIQALEASHWTLAHSLYKKTASTYEQAIEMARSYPDNYIKLCHVKGLLLVDAVQRTGIDAQTYADGAIKACQNYLITYPDDYTAMDTLARIYMMLAQWQSSAGIDTTPTLHQARYWNRQSLALSIDLSTIWTQALIETIAASQMLYRGENIQQQLNRINTSFDQAFALATGPQPHLSSDRLFIFAIEIEQAFRQQEDISTVLNQAEALYREALDNPNLLSNERRVLLINMGAVYYAQLGVLFHQGADIQTHGSQLIALYSQELNETFREPNLPISLANTYLLLAQNHYRNDRSAEQDLNTASEWAQQAYEINQNDPGILLTLAEIDSLRATITFQDFSSANLLYQQALDANPAKALTYYAWAESRLVQALLAPSKGIRKKLLLEGQQLINSALSIDASNHVFLKTQSELDNHISEH
ncbi:protein kinase [Marinicella sp. W31]|uniref:serine/threonine-protein kinase n=1 Tax=Marinicella sp. W31 TaxID=3023713 RepID=UPI0037565659